MYFLAAVIKLFDRCCPSALISMPSSESSEQHLSSRSLSLSMCVMPFTSPGNLLKYYLVLCRAFLHMFRNLLLRQNAKQRKTKTYADNMTAVLIHLGSVGNSAAIDGHNSLSMY